MLKHFKKLIVKRVKKKIGSPSEPFLSNAPSVDTPTGTESPASTDVTALTDLAGGPPSALNESSSNLDSTLLLSPASATSEAPSGSKLVRTSTLATFGELQSRAYEDIVSDPSNVGAKTNARSIAFHGFKTVLTVIRESADVFPPLKSVAGGILALMDVLETTSANQEDRTRLETQIGAILSILNNYQKQPQTLSIARRLEGLSIAMEHQVAILGSQKEHAVVRRAAEGKNDAAAIAGVYRTLSYLFDAFQMDTALATENTTQQILSHILIDKLPRAIHAKYNKASPVGRNLKLCTEGTRIAILARLMSWAADVASTKIYWLTGMAGTGKTTIAYSFSEILDKNQMLGATFFCSRLDGDSRNTSCIFPTLAYQLASYSSTFFHALVHILQNDPDAGAGTMYNQFHDLVIVPAQAAFSTNPIGRSIIIIIEALDECADQKAVTQMLSIISQHAPKLPLKFFITSRPEQQIWNWFNHPSFEPHSRFILHDVEEDVVGTDIELYLKTHLREIAYERSNEVSADTWPTAEQLKILVHHAGKLFIYAATVCEYVEGGRSVRARLNVATSVSGNDLNGKTDTLDNLYGHIVNAAYAASDDEEKLYIKKVLQVVISASNPLSIDAMSTLLQTGCDTIYAALQSLHAVVKTPPKPDFGCPISTFHASFPDFITNEKRSGNNFLDLSQSHQWLALQCLTLVQSLKRVLSGISGQSSDNNTSLLTINEHISGGLAYACIYWPYHISKIDIERGIPEDVYKALWQFFDHDVLQWTECMSLLHNLGVAVDALQKLEHWARSDHLILTVIRDVHKFITQGFELFTLSRAEIYHSALLWVPEQSHIHHKYAKSSTCTWKMILGAKVTWGACKKVLLGHTNYVNFAVYSPDGMHIASVSDDKTCRIWNATTGDAEAELKEHSGYVRSVVFSPDGNHIASASMDGTVCIWNTTTGDMVIKLTGHSDSVRSAVFSPDGNHVVSASADNMVHIWNATTGELEAQLEGHSDYVRSAVFSPNGTCIVSASYDNTARIWNARTGEALAELIGHTGAVQSAVFSPDGDHVVTASYDNDVCIWNAKTGEAEAELKGHSHFVRFATFSPDGTHIVSACDDHTVRIWDAKSGEPKAELKGHSNWVNYADYSPDGAHVISASADKTIRIWNAITGETEAELRGHSGSVRSAIFSPDGIHVVSSSADKTIRIWNATTGETEARDSGHSGLVQSVVFSVDGKYILSASDDKTVCMWNAATGNTELELHGHSGLVQIAVFSSGGAHIISASYDDTVCIWNAKTGKQEAELRGHSRSVQSVAFSPDGNHVVSASEDNTIRIWNARTGEPEAELKGHSNYVRSAIFSSDGTQIVSASKDHTVRIWNATTGEAEAELRGHSKSVQSAVFSPDDSQVVSASKDKTIRIWNAKTRKVVAELKGHSNAVQSAVFSPDGTRIASASRDLTVCIWNAATGEAEAVLKGHSDWVQSALFSPDGNHVVSASKDFTVGIWDVMTGELKVQLRGHSSYVQSALFSPDGNHVVSASYDNTVRIWNSTTGEEEATLQGHSGLVQSAVFSPDGTCIVSASYDNTVRIWNSTTGELEAELRGHSGLVQSAVFSPDGTHVASASADKMVRIWNVMSGNSIVCAEHAVLSDGSKVYHRADGHFHITPALETYTYQEIDVEDQWITHRSSKERCWLPAQYTKWNSIAYYKSKVCLGYTTGEVLLLEYVG